MTSGPQAESATGRLTGQGGDGSVGVGQGEFEPVAAACNCQVESSDPPRQHSATVLHMGFQSVPYSQLRSPGSEQRLPLSGTDPGQAAASEPVAPDASAGKAEPVELPPSEAVTDVHAPTRIRAARGARSAVCRGCIARPYSSAESR